VKSSKLMLKSPVLMISKASRTQMSPSLGVEILERRGVASNEKTRHTSCREGKSRASRRGRSKRVKLPVIRFRTGPESRDRLLLDPATKSPVILSIPLRFIVVGPSPVRITFPVKLAQLLQISASSCDAMLMAPLGPVSAVQFSTATFYQLSFTDGLGGSLDERRWE
jgi:hypothetical protein